MVISFYSSQDSHLILTQISMWMYPFASILRQHVKQIHALLMITLPCTLVSQFTSVTLSCPTFCDPMDCNTLGFPVLINSWSLLNLMSIQLVMPSNHLILCRPLLLLSSIFHSIRSFPMNQFFTSGGPSIGVSASASVLPRNIQDWFPSGLTGLISLLSKGLSRVFSNTPVQKHQFFSTQPL